MRLRYRLIAIVAIAALLPLLVAGWATARVANRNMLELARQLQLQQAKELSTLTETWLYDRLKGLRLLSGVWQVDQLDEEGRLGFLRLIYSQYDSVNVVALLSAEGALLTRPVYQEKIDPLGEWARHQPVAQERADFFVEQAPWEEALRSGAALGEPYRPPDSNSWVVPIATQASSGVLVAEVSLVWLEDHFSQRSMEGQTAALLDGEGHVIAGAGGALLDLGVFSKFRGNLEGDVEYALSGGTEVFANFDSVGGTPWTVVVASPRVSAEAVGSEIRRDMLYFYGLAAVLTAAVGFVGASQISQPIVALKDAALAVADGDLGRRVTPSGSLELSELGRAFNFMSRRLKLNREEIAEKKQEIEAFNADLQRRVEERTRELKEAQGRLVESSRLAAVAHMGAGLAHELNNPIAGILGMTQLAIARAGQGNSEPTLRAIEAQAQRCREILSTLNRLTAEAPGERAEVDLHPLLRSVLELTRSRIQERGVEVLHLPGAPLKAQVDPARLGQAISQLLLSLSLKLAPGGRIRITGESREERISLRFALEGPERQAQDDWLASGMGFWMAHQVVGQHGGLLLESQSDSDRSYQLTLPRAPRA